MYACSLDLTSDVVDPFMQVHDRDTVRDAQQLSTNNLNINITAKTCHIEVIDASLNRKRRRSHVENQEVGSSYPALGHLEVVFFHRVAFSSSRVCPILMLPTRVAVFLLNSTMVV